MPRSLEALYKEGGARFGVDSCAPQFAAMRDGKIHLRALTKGHYPGIPMNTSQLPSITSIGYWSCTGAQNWGTESHRNEGLEITFLETGSMAFSVDAKNYELSRGHFTITRPWQLHKLGAPHIMPGKLHWLIMDLRVHRPNQEWRWPRWLSMTDEDRMELSKKLRHNENPVWDASPAISEAFRDIGECVARWPGPQLESLMIALLNRLFVEILVVLGAQCPPKNPHLASRPSMVEIFLRTLAEDPSIAREPWTLPQMANQCGMGITAFSGYCRSLVNAGGIDYLNQCRINHAAKEVREVPERPVTEIAFSGGFNSSQYFATVFGKRFKMTPSAYRRHPQPIVPAVENAHEASSTVGE